MEPSKLMHKKMLFYGLVLTMLLCGAALWFHYVVSPATLSRLANDTVKWDGSIAASFSGGNGTEDNPYLISNGSELAYFKQIVESDKDGFYKDKFFALSYDIDMNNIPIDSIGEEVLNEDDITYDEYVFSGHLDGRGNTIGNLVLTSSKFGDEYYNGLFAKTVNTTIENLNIESLDINDNTENTYAGALAGYSDNSTFEYITVIDAKIKEENSTNLKSGLMFGSIKDTSILKSYLGGNLEINKSDTSLIGTVSGSNIETLSEDGSTTNTIMYLMTSASYTDETLDNKVFFGDNTKTYEYMYYSVRNNDDTITFKNDNQGDLSLEELIEFLNGISGTFKWQEYKGNLVYEEEELPEKSQYELLANPTATITEHASGIENNTLYVNDLEADWYYYYGQNYTYSTNGLIPTSDKKNIYNSNNLVKVQITYNGSRTLTNGEVLTGTVSTTEPENKFVYYKYYPVNDNGTSYTSDDYLDIELIDNPFTNRPEDDVFNGWTTNYVGATVSIDQEYYERHVKVPVTYANNTPEDIVIEMTASWVRGSVVMLGNNWDNAFADLDDVGMKQLSNTIQIRDFYDMSDYFVFGGTAPRRSYYTGYTANGTYRNNAYCNKRNGCPYYNKIDGEDYNDNVTYYTLDSIDGAQVVNPNTLNFTYSTVVDYEHQGNVAGLYKRVTVPIYSSIVGYYDELGEYQSSGTCYTYGGCTYYEFMQYYNSSGQENMNNGVDTYYYLVTRDTNIIILNQTINTEWGNYEIPFTLTSVYNGIDYRDTAYYNVSSIPVRCYGDTVLENIYIYTTTNTLGISPSLTSSSSSYAYFYGRYNNVKLGRGIIRNGNYVNFSAFFGGANTAKGSTSNIAKYKLIVESGYYSDGTPTNGGIGTSNVYAEAKAIIGCDYDRITEGEVTNTTSTNLTINDSMAGEWGGNNYASSNTAEFLNWTIKSGRFGAASNRDNTSGIYTGQRQGGSAYALRVAKFEGGWTNVINGGPSVGTNMRTLNSMKIFITGGNLQIVFGGAGTTTTYGNRIIQMTGGTVHYGLLGGSNAYDSTSGDGTIYGSSFVYLGGKAVIGDQTLINNNNKLYVVESGSVFGHGNGSNSTSTSVVGSNDNSTVIIDGDAHILRNVYGAANNGQAGSTTNQSSTNLKVIILDGQIDGNVYAGGNNNGAGSTSILANASVDVYGGTIGGAVYGGSNVRGTIYGDSTVNIYGGTIGSVYGGGQGNTTYVERNVNVKIGDTSIDTTPLINDSVYGGSALGTVNNTTGSTAARTYTTNVTVNKGTITGSVFGGGEGDNSYTPYVAGPVTVDINGGNVANVYGGCDLKGMPNSTIDVNLNGGTVGNALGGGNNIGVNRTNVNLQGSTVNYVYGGSNQNGTVTESHVYAKSGTSNYVFGGNNAGGTMTASDVHMQGANVTYAYGGNNQAGTTTTSNIFMEKGTVKQIYGGGDVANTGTTNLTIQGGYVFEAYGGGNNAGATTTHNNITGGVVLNAFGGSNHNGNVTTSNININQGSGATNPVYMDVQSTFQANTWNQAGKKNVILLNITIHNNTSNALDIYSGTIIAPNTTIGYNNSQVNITESDGTYTFDQANRYWGTNTVPANGTYTFEFALATDLGDGEVPVSASLAGSTSANGESFASSDYGVTNVYGGNNFGGVTSSANIELVSGTVNQIFGGGNEAQTTNNIIDITGGTANNVYGGGNKAVTTQNTTVNITNALIKDSVYAGGNIGNVNGNTNLTLANATINGSAYGGGNQADVLQNATTNVGGTTVISQNLFGGGNLGAIGTAAANNSTSTVNLVGGAVGKNVYGGCNTSVVYGITDTNIGIDASTNKSLAMNNISVAGTVFGGGEANASGSENYDYSFISVTSGIDIEINGNTYEDAGYSFLFSGSIFGSGNASSSSGTSTIYVKDLGTRAHPSSNISIQRADTVTIDNSVMELVGTTDRTNDYSTIKYSINRVDTLKLKNNAVLMVQQNANLLKSFYSLVDVNGQEQKAQVTIDDETKTVTSNVNNRLYVIANKNLNITTNQSATSYGVVSGMTFFGMYTKYANGSYQYGLYDRTVNYGDAGDAGDVIFGGSYVLGLHSLNHDITVDGFYTNYIDDAYTEITTAYIDPTPPDANYYMWTIGIQAINYEFSLTASKYSSLGTYELSLRDFAAGDTIFNVIGFNSEGLTSGISLADSNNVPKITDDPDIANSIIGLSMKSETSEWTNYGTTKFMSDGNGIFTGTNSYKTDSQAGAPSLMFYLYHAKNISLDQDLGSVIVTLQAMTPINEIEYQVDLITVTININARSYDDGDAYDASITYSKKYEMPSATTVNITNKSQFTAYYSLFTTAESFDKFYGNSNEYYRSLTSNFVLPVGTKITMLDYGADQTNPEEYYYIINQTDFNASQTEFNTYGEVSYDLSNFIRMGSTTTTNTYKDATENQVYYKTATNAVLEEFIFIFDFQDTNMTGNQLNNTIFLELRNGDDRAVISVLSIRQPLMTYSLYQTSNIALEQGVTMPSEYIYNNTDIAVPYTTTVAYDQTDNRESVIDTNYESNNMGLNISFVDAHGTQVSSTQLEDTTITIDNVLYHSDSNGVFRIRLAGKVSNLIKNIRIHIGNALPTGTYNMTYKLFASEDGLYSNGSQEINKTFEETLLGNDNAIIVNTQQQNQIIDLSDQDVAKTLNYTINYHSELADPNVRVSIYKRNTDNSATTEYTEVNMSDIFLNAFVLPSYYTYHAGTTYEKMITKTPQPTINISYDLKTDVVSGTYKLSFKLYNSNHTVDTVDKYFILKKDLTE